MMTAQRAYQANAQTIKTQDQVMSTLVNLRWTPESLRAPLYAARCGVGRTQRGGAVLPSASALAELRQLHAQWTACGIAGN